MPDIEVLVTAEVSIHDLTVLEEVLPSFEEALSRCVERGVPIEAIIRGLMVMAGTGLAQVYDHGTPDAWRVTRRMMRTMVEHWRVASGRV